jgi:hypothetical protein
LHLLLIFSYQCSQNWNLGVVIIHYEDWFLNQWVVCLFNRNKCFKMLVQEGLISLNIFQMLLHSLALHSLQLAEVIWMLLRDPNRQRKGSGVRNVVNYTVGRTLYTHTSGWSVGRNRSFSVPIALIVLSLREICKNIWNLSILQRDVKVSGCSQWSVACKFSEFC